MSASGAAGKRGKDVRSDCWVSIEPTESGGLKLNLTSRVAFLYEESIRSQVTGLLQQLGIENARVEIEDHGALPFVIAARVEAAARRALPDRDLPAGLPEPGQKARATTSRDRWRRSRLYLPGNEPKYMLNAGLHHPDAVILDIEDSVAPTEKDAALMLVRNALLTLDFGPSERMVRINQFPRGLDELEHLVPHNLHLVLIPKCESPDQVRETADRIRDIWSRKGTGTPLTGETESPVFLMPIVESALGVIRAYEIASASPGVVALTIGLEDYTADLGTQRTVKGRESFWARSQVVNAARAAGVQAIDTVFSDVADVDGLRASVREAKGLGFEGKGCIHPRQIQVVHETFAPTEAEIARATRIARAYAEAQDKGLGVVALGSKMIDPPVVKRALKTVDAAIAAGLLAPNWRDEETR